MKNFILGAGGFAKEVALLFENSVFSNSKLDGFIDSEPKTEFILIKGRKIRVITEESFFTDNSETDVNLFLGTGDPNINKKLISKYSSYNFPNLIDSRSQINLNYNKIGVGNIFTAGVIMTIDIELGSYNILNLNSTIGHDSKIGSFNVINPGCNISGGVGIGDLNLLGTNSTILQNIVIGSNNVLGAGSVLIKNILNNETHVGVPNKRIK
jgi:sugar O-acyltransferase (sialic acid O-acetyltransferase NeuD family)